MNCFTRPYIRAGIALLGAAITLAPAMAGAQAGRISEIVEEPNPLLLHSGSPGYLGVLVGDVDIDSANKLKLKEVRGALITLIDHDAPAAQVGLRVNDVVLEINGQAVENAEAFGRMMHEIPPGRKITLSVSRDGATQTLAVQLVDRKKLDTDVWNRLNNDTDPSSPVDGLGILGGNGLAGDAPLPGGFHMPFVGSSTLKVGAMVEPLTSQMAEYLGVQNGLMVKQVVRKSEASAAGMKAFDIILKVGNESISTVSDWERSMRANQGKAVQITILRGQKQQIITLQVDSKRRGAVEFEQLLPDGPGPLWAYADSYGTPDLSQEFGMDQFAADSVREQAEKQKLKNQPGVAYFGITPEQAEALHKQAEQQIADALKNKTFGVDQKQFDQLKQQMQEWQKCCDFKSFQFDQQQMDELKKQMQQFGETFKTQSFKFDQKQMDEFKRQMQQFRQVHPLDEKMREQMKKQMDQLKRQLEDMPAQSFGHWV